MTVLERSELEASPLADLHAIADQVGLDGFRRLRKAELIDAILGDPETAPGTAPSSESPRPRRSRPAASPHDRARPGQARRMIGWRAPRGACASVGGRSQAGPDHDRADRRPRAGHRTHTPDAPDRKTRGVAAPGRGRADTADAPTGTRRRPGRPRPRGHGRSPRPRARVRAPLAAERMADGAERSEGGSRIAIA